MDNKGFCKCLNDKRKTRENESLLLNETEDMVTSDSEKTKVPNTFFASILTSKTSFQEPQVPEARLNGQGKKNEHLIEEDQVREYKSELKICKSVGPARMQPEMLSELVIMMVKLLCNLSLKMMATGRSAQSLEESKCHSQDKQEGGPSPLSLKGDGILQIISRHMKEKTIIGCSQHGFTKRKSCLTNS